MGFAVQRLAVKEVPVVRIRYGTRDLAMSRTSFPNERLWGLENHLDSGVFLLLNICRLYD